MKNQPKRIWLDLGFAIRNVLSKEIETGGHFKMDITFDDCENVTWSADNATGNGLEYISVDQMFEFMKWMGADFGKKGAEWWYEKFKEENK